MVDRTPLAVALTGAHVVDDLGARVAGDYGDPAAEYEALRGAAGLVDRSARAAVVVTGPDARSFLQSLVSQDVDPLADGEGARSLLLEPRGKLVADFRALRVGEEEWWLDAEVGAGDALAGGLRRFLIRVKVEVTDRTGRWGEVSVLGPQAPAVVADTLGVAVPEVPYSHVPFGPHRVVRAGWPGLPGVDVVGPVDGLGEVWERLAATIPPVGLAAAEVARVEAGVPRLGLDLDETTIPQEAFLDREAISFTKGCFVGQELACRIDTRGHVNRHLRGLRFAGDRLPPRGAEVRHDGGTVGRVTSAASLPGRPPVGLALVRREVTPAEPVSVVWEGGETAAEVVELPATPTD